MKVKHKYRLWEIVYIRLWLMWDSMVVTKWKITENKWAVSWKYPYYSASYMDWTFLSGIIYESNISRRPERLVKQALKKVEEEYWWYIRAYKYHKKELKKLLYKS